MIKVNFIGCGRLGRTIARLFHQHSIAEIAGIINSTYESSLEAIEFVGQGNAVRSIDELPPADITFITTKDDRIEKICQELARHCVLKSSSIVAHCSGALSSDILSAAKSSSQCYVASIHPVRSFANPLNTVNTFSGTFCSLEGDKEAKPMLTQLFETIGATILFINKESKKRYHAATAIANNYLVTLHHQAVQNFIHSGIDESIATKLVSGLMLDAFNNLKTMPHTKALTGPIQRGDISTITGHIKSFGDDTVAKCIYSSLGLGTLTLTAHPPTIISEFKNIFNDSLQENTSTAIKSRL